MVKGYLFGVTEESMKVIILTIYLMVKDCFFGPMVMFLMVNGKMGCSMVKE